MIDTASLQSMLDELAQQCGGTSIYIEKSPLHQGIIIRITGVLGNNYVRQALMLSDYEMNSVSYIDILDKVYPLAKSVEDICDHPRTRALQNIRFDLEMSFP